MFQTFRQTSDTESGDFLDNDDDEPRMLQLLHLSAEQRRNVDSKDVSVEENDEIDENHRRVGKCDLANSKTINDILKYGAHHSNDSHPIETQSEWSDDDDEAKGGVESTGYITDEPGLENLSLLNEAGLTDAEAALSDVNSCNAHDADDTSISSRASSRLLSLDSLSGFYDNEMDASTSRSHEKAIMNVSTKITNKFGSQALQ